MRHGVQNGFVASPNAVSLLDFEEVLKESRKREGKGRASWNIAPPTRGFGTFVGKDIFNLGEEGFCVKGYARSRDGSFAEECVGVYTQDEVSEESIADFHLCPLLRLRFQYRYRWAIFNPIRYGQYECHFSARVDVYAQFNRVDDREFLCTLRLESGGRQIVVG